MTDVAKRLEAVIPIAKNHDLLQCALTEIQKLREVLQWCAEQAWEGSDIEVGDLQDAMLNAGLLVEVDADEDFKAEWDTDKMYVVAWSPLAKEKE